MKRNNSYTASLAITDAFYCCLPLELAIFLIGLNTFERTSLLRDALRLYDEIGDLYDETQTWGGH